MNLKTVYRTSFFTVFFILCSFCICPPASASLPPTAVVSAGSISGIAPLTVSFDASGSAADTDRTIAGYSWQFGDGTLAVGSSVSYTYSGYGIFTAVLKVTDDAGLSDTETVTINVRNGGIFTAADINNDGVIDLADFTVLASQWLKAPSQVSADIDQTAASKGVIDLADLLKLSDNWLFENDPPTAVISYDDPNIMAGELVILGSSGSSDPQGSALRYLWDFGDGTPVVQTGYTAAWHIFDAAGSYNVTLTAFDGDLSATVQQVITVNPAIGGGGSLGLSASAIDFGPLYASATWGERAFSNEKFIELANNGPGPLILTSVWSTNPSAFKIVYAPFLTPLAQGDKHFIAVKFEPRVLNTDPVPPLGAWSGDMVIVTTGGTQTVPLGGTTVPWADVSGLASPLLMSYNYTAPLSNPVASVKDFGQTESDASIVFVSIGNQGGVNMYFPSIEITGPDSIHFTGEVLGASLWLHSLSVGEQLSSNKYTSGFWPPLNGGIKLTFKPQITGPTSRRLTAKAIIHTTGGDLEVALMGSALYKPKLKITKMNDFEFVRVAPGKSTSTLGSLAGTEDWYAFPAEITVSNTGTAPVTISMSITDISPGAASKFSFAPFGTMTLGRQNPSVKMTGTFAPNVKGNHSALLTLTPSDPNYPVDYTLLHGVATGSGVYPLGTAESWHTVDDWYFYTDDFDYAKIIEMKNNGQVGSFGDLYEIPDPFLVSDPYNHLWVEDWLDYQNSLVIYGGTEYAIASYLFGPYTLGYSENTADTNTRLAAGEKIGSGGILKTSGFINDIDGNKDILHEGSKPLLMDIAPDGTIFYTESFLESGIVRTRLKWLSGAVGGIVTENLSVLFTDQPGSEPVVLRAIAGSSYRLFIAFGTSMYDMDLNSSHAITATKNLTGLLSAMPNEVSRIDALGNWVTVASDVPGHIQVFKENLHNGGKTLFAQATVAMPDTALNCLVDRLGNIFVQTDYGIYQFSPAGAAMHYVLAGEYFYSTNEIGTNPYQDKNAEWYMDFNLLWFSR